MRDKACKVTSAQLCHVRVTETPLISSQQRRVAILGQFHGKSCLHQAQTAHLDQNVQERSLKICRCGAKASAAVAISGCGFKSLQFRTRVFLQNSKRLPVSLALVLKLTNFTVSTKSSGSGGINEESQKRFQSEGGKRVVPGRRRAAEASLISQRLPNSQQSPSMNFP